jgi:hypothetical protein
MAGQHDLADQLLQRASDDEAAARAMLPVESVTDMIVGMLAQCDTTLRTQNWSIGQRRCAGPRRP